MTFSWLLVCMLSMHDVLQPGCSWVCTDIKGEKFEAEVDTGAVLLDLDNIDSEKIRKLLRKPAD